MENKGNTGISIKDLVDTTSDGFTYVPGSTTSSPSSLPVAAATTTELTVGEPTTDTTKDTITWSFGGIGVYLATSTTWYLQFKTTATLDRGFYPNNVDISFAGSQAPTPAQADFCEFEEASLTISSGESFDCPIGSNGDVTIDQQATVAGDVMSLSGDIVIGQQGEIGSATVDGDLIALGGDITINQQSVVNGDIIASGSLTLDQQVTVKGNVIVGGDFTLDQQVTIEGYIWAGGNITVAQQVTFGGDIIAGGDIHFEQQSTVSGDVYAAGTITTDSNVTLSGTVTDNAVEVPSYPPIDLRSAGSTAMVTAIDIYRVTTTDGETTQTCDVYVIEDADVGNVGTVENCTNA
jgi:cytoskeletal protein CcmA (bactofilin family)